MIKKAGSCWPEYLSVCSHLRWKSLLKLITSINSFPFFANLYFVLNSSINLLHAWFYLHNYLELFPTVTCLSILFLTFILVFQTLLKYQHMHSFQCVILLLTEPFCSINKVVVYCLFVFLLVVKLFSLGIEPSIHSQLDHWMFKGQLA